MNIKNDIDNEEYIKKISLQNKKDILIARREMPYEDITNELIEKAMSNNNEINV